MTVATRRRSASPGRPRDGVRVIDRAIDILHCFDETDERLTLQQLADRAGIHKATAFRIVATLVEARILDQPAPGGAYELGFFALGRADAILGASALVRAARPIMVALHDELGETVILAERHGDMVVSLDKVVSRHGVVETPLIGVALPLHDSSAGLAVLATFAADARDDYLRRACPPAVHAALHDRLDRLRATLADPRKAPADDAVLAAPIIDRAGVAIAALAIAVPAGRLAPRLIARCLTRLAWATRELRPD